MAGNLFGYVHGVFQHGLPKLNLAMQSMGLEHAIGWRGTIMDMVGYDFKLFDNFLHGLLYFLPVYMTTFIVVRTAEVAFALVRGHEVNEGFSITSICIHWYCHPIFRCGWSAWESCRGVILRLKRVFGSTGKNFINPALAGRAFLFFAYLTAFMSGDAVWVAVDGLFRCNHLIRRRHRWNAGGHGELVGCVYWA